MGLADCDLQADVDIFLSGEFAALMVVRCADFDCVKLHYLTDAFGPGPDSVVGRSDAQVMGQPSSTE